MNAVELVHFSLKNSFDVLDMVVSDLTQEQADWKPPGELSPISAHYWHAMSYADQVLHETCMPPITGMTFNEFFNKRLTKKVQFTGKVPVRHSKGWYERVVLSLPPHNPEDPFWDIRLMPDGLQVDLDVLHDYAHEVAETILRWIRTLTQEDLERKIITPIGDYSLGNFIACFVIWNNNVHCGEISAIKGLQGLKGYPW
jgi:hypothetical protein